MKAISSKETKEGKQHILDAPPEKISTHSGGSILHENWPANNIARKQIEDNHDNSVYRMMELDEVIGDLHHMENTDVGLIAQISKVRVLLPEELASKLNDLIGKRIGILRYDGYRVRCLDE
jgi:hypothetical protein